MSSYSLSDTFGLFSRPEIDALKEITRRLPNNSIAVVLGASAGTATLAILEARNDIIVHSVDLVDCPTERLEARTGGFLARLHQILGHSTKTGLSWKGPVDLLFVDACHTYEAVKADSAAWLPHLKDGGIAWYHDYGTANGMWMMVKTAVDEDMKGQEQIVRVQASIAFRWKVKVVNKADSARRGT